MAKKYIDSVKLQRDIRNQIYKKHKHLSIFEFAQELHKQAKKTELMKWFLTSLSSKETNNPPK